MANKTILIADAGGTSTDWRLIRDSKIQQFVTGGFNLFTHPVDQLKQEILSLNIGAVDEVFFYSAGADTKEQRQSLSDELSEVFGVLPNVENDLLGAARATCGSTPGFVGILGTGANASYYDGNQVEKVSASLGYVLGDEGSGAYLGKQLLKCIYRSEFQKSIIEAYQNHFHLPVDQAIRNLYASNRPNQYLASFVPFLADHKNEPEIYRLIHRSFQDFFEAFFKHTHVNHPIHFVGSIAFHFSDILRQAAVDSNLMVGTIIASPIAGLVLYHQHE